jgi:fatty acyl-ACP thioesterase A
LERPTGVPTPHPHQTQEIAAHHAVALWGRSDQGFANQPSLKEIVFVMTRLQVQMDAYPKW